MGWYLTVWRKCTVFSGRARRTEYWAFQGWNALLFFVVGLIEGATQSPYATEPSGLMVLASLYQVAIVLPTVAAGVRRMHDTGRNGWWLVCPVANFVLLVSGGNRGPNKYGPDPKEVGTHGGADPGFAQLRLGDPAEAAVRRPD